MTETTLSEGLFYTFIPACGKNFHAFFTLCSHPLPLSPNPAG